MIARPAIHGEGIGVLFGLPLPGRAVMPQIAPVQDPSAGADRPVRVPDTTPPAKKASTVATMRYHSGGSGLRRGVRGQAPAAPVSTGE